MKFKQTPQEVKAIDEKEGIVKAYANVYEVEDADGDISMPGSFTKTVQENKKRIRVLKDHMSTVSLGVPIEMDAQDPHGLFTTTKFNMEKSVARDMFTDIQLMMEHDLNAELSIGYEVVKRNEEDRRKIEEYKLYEYSFLTGWAANPSSTTQEIKSIKSKHGIIDFLSKAYNLNYSDERLSQIESLLKSLEGVEPSDKDTQDIEPIGDVFDQLITKMDLQNESLWTLKN